MRIRNMIGYISFLAGLILLCSSFVRADDSKQAAISADPVSQVEVFEELPLGTIKPKGWLKTFLEKQRDGLTGNIEVAGYPFNTNMWAGKSISEKPDENEWASYEQTAYWIDGALKCGYMLDDEKLKKRAIEQIDYVLKNVGRYDYLGPIHLNDTRWPHVVFFRAMMAYSSTEDGKDKAVIDAIAKHYIGDFQGRQDNGEKTFMGNIFGRNHYNVEQLCWLYKKTQDKRFLDFAMQMYDKVGDSGQMLSDDRMYTHGVSWSEMLKLPAMLYMCTGQEKYLKMAENGFYKTQRDHLLADGVPSSTEELSGKGSRVPHESCVISDYSWSQGYMLMITKQAKWADATEKTCFNAGPGAVTKDFKAHQYLSAMNQPIATHKSNYEQFQEERMAYRPGHPVKCCSGNIHRFMPNYVYRMWLSDGEGGLVAAMYGPSTVEAKVNNGKNTVRITEETDYPFSELIKFVFSTAESVDFNFRLRIPSWCDKAKISINGKVFADAQPKPGEFVKIQRKFSDKDIIVLELPMTVELKPWAEDGIIVERGPLLYSLDIAEKKDSVKYPDSGLADNDPRVNEYPAYDFTPLSEWNYGLTFDSKDKIKVVMSAMQENPWIKDNCPIHLEIPACRIKGWKLQQITNDNGEIYSYTPHLPGPRARQTDGKQETVKLVPYGCTHLRITVFPQVKR